MSQSVSQFIFFRVKSSVKPEDPSSEEGEALLNVFCLTKQQNGHQGSAWGRVVEDTDTIVWVVGEYFSTTSFFYLALHHTATAYVPRQKANKRNRLVRPPHCNGQVAP